MVTRLAVSYKSSWIVNIELVLNEREFSSFKMIPTEQIAAYLVTLFSQTAERLNA